MKLKYARMKLARDRKVQEPDRVIEQSQMAVELLELELDYLGSGE